MTMAALKNITWVGTGSTGLATLHKLVAKPQFSIHLLVRNPVSTYSNLPSALASVTQVDYAAHDALVKNLTGKDAVIVFSSFAPGTRFDLKHIALVNAAIEAGVKYFIPSEWALDSAGASESTTGLIGPTLPTNMVLAPKRVSHNYLLCRAAEGRINFAVIYCGVLVESCLQNGMLQFDFSTRTANLADAGTPPFPATSITTLARSILSLLQSPSKISNRFYHVADGVLTQREILSIISRVTGAPWAVSSFSVEVEREAAAQNMRDGTYGMREYMGTLRTAFFGGIQSWVRVDNEVLGLGGEEEGVDIREEVARLAREHVARPAGEERGSSRI